MQTLELDIEKANGFLAKQIRDLKDKDREVITPYVFNKKNDATIKTFVENLNQSHIDKLKNLETLAPGQHAALKKIRVEVIENTISKLTEERAKLTAARIAVDIAAATRANEEITKLTRQFKKFSPAEIVKLDSKILSLPETLDLIADPKYLKKMVDEEYTPIKDPTGNEVDLRIYVGKHINADPTKFPSAKKFIDNETNSLGLFS